MAGIRLEAMTAMMAGEFVQQVGCLAFPVLDRKDATGVVVNSCRAREEVEVRAIGDIVAAAGQSCTGEVQPGQWMNVNDRVLVELTPEGMEVLNRRWNMAGMTILRGSRINGRIMFRLPLWELMEIFGSMLYVGADPMFVDNRIERAG